MIINDTNLTPMQKGRLNKVLEKKAIYNNGVMTLKAYLESLTIDSKKIVNGSCRWNRYRYNKMSAKEQNAYEKKLINDRYYNLYFGSYCIEIPKILFDVLELPDVTDLDSLKRL